MEPPRQRVDEPPEPPVEVRPARARLPLPHRGRGGPSSNLVPEEAVLWGHGEARGGARGGGGAGDVAAGAYRPGCLLVTGGAGFIASHVVARLLERYPDYRVRALPFPLPPPPPLYLLYHLAGHPAAAPATTSSRPVRYAPI